jgi:hypothetical protein
MAYQNKKRVSATYCEGNLESSPVIVARAPLFGQSSGGKLLTVAYHNQYIFLMQGRLLNRWSVLRRQDASAAGENISAFLLNRRYDFLLPTTLHNYMNKMKQTVLLNVPSTTRDSHNRGEESNLLYNTERQTWITV